VKLQEEVKSARSAQRSAEEMLSVEKERSKAREQEAFAARYSLVGVQEQLEQALERIKMLEQERDAFKALAKTEEDIARIAAEGRLPLPPSGSDGDDDEFASPKKKKPRVSSVSIADIKSSATSEMEIEELTMLWQWEKQRAERAIEHVEFLQAECQLKCCPCAKSHARLSLTALPPASTRRKRADPLKIADAGDLVILSEDASATMVPDTQSSPSPKKSKTDMLRSQEQRNQPRQSTIFVPREGIFRTVSQEEAEAMEIAQSIEPEQEQEVAESPAQENQNPRFYARTPSVEPPSFAMIQPPRTSLLSLLDAPHQLDRHPAPVFEIPTAEDLVAELAEPEDEDIDETVTLTEERTPLAPVAVNPNLSPSQRPHTSAAFYTTATTTTKVPLRDENDDPSLASRLMAMQRTPSCGSRSAETPSFDVSNPALTPTMTREQALAQIRARRGRARSAAQGMPATPRRPILEGAGVSERRDLSAPAGRVTGAVVGVSGARRVRS
jgi:hypothetical protein